MALECILVVNGEQLIILWEIQEVCTLLHSIYHCLKPDS